MNRKLNLYEKIKRLRLMRINNFVVGFCYPICVKDGYISGHKSYKFVWEDIIKRWLYKKNIM